VPRIVTSGRIVRALLLALFLVLLLVPAVAANGPHVVQRGETLSGIAQKYGISTGALAAANGLQANAWVYAGQSLQIPGRSGGAVAAAAQPATSGAYQVRAGDTLSGIASRHGTTVQAIMNANGLSSTTIYAGQRLAVPGASGQASTSAPPANNPGVGGGKWIDVDLTRQRITAYEGQRAVYSAIVSTGLPRTPTVVGTYKIYAKFVATDMRGGSHAAGDYYHLRDVPYTMYFHGSYGIHGTYWHNNFGQPMSRGCVNLRTSDARWFFNWAPIGTPVVTHY
jgi:LysM repeat protein